jgi:hypothetical protein
MLARHSTSLILKKLLAIVFNFTQTYPHLINCHNHTLHIGRVDVFLCVEILYLPKWTKITLIGCHVFAARVEQS